MTSQSSNSLPAAAPQVQDVAPKTIASDAEIAAQLRKLMAAAKRRWNRRASPSTSSPETDIVERLRELMKKASPLPWCIESCGSKGDGSDMIGVAFHPDDKDAKTPLSGYLEEVDDDGNFIDYYRDELVAECAHYPRGNPGNPQLIMTTMNALPALLDEIERLRAREEGRNAVIEANNLGALIFNIMPDCAANLLTIADCEEMAAQIIHALAFPVGEEDKS